MKAAIKIPAGWRRLRISERIKKGDRELWKGDMLWEPVSPHLSHGSFCTAYEFIIRRAQRPKKLAPKDSKRFPRRTKAYLESELEDANHHTFRLLEIISRVREAADLWDCDLTDLPAEIGNKLRKSAK